MAVSRRLRFEVLRRDGHACRYCGRTAPEVQLTIDHVMPVALGGHDDLANLAAACSECNSGKGSTSLDCHHCEGALNDFFTDFFGPDKLAKETIEYYVGEAEARSGFGERWPGCPRWMLAFMGAVMDQRDTIGQLQWYLDHPRAGV